MGLTYRIDAEAGVIYSVAEGEIVAADILGRREQLKADPLYSPDFVLLTDARSAQYNLSGEEARSLVNSFLATRHYSKMALVVGSGSRGYIRMYQGWSGDDTSIRVFEDMASAREWLGLPPEEE